MRINCIPVEYLTDQHLRAEWVEMLMLPAFMKRSLRAKGHIEVDNSIEYRLNKGHAKFFYNKLKYVEKRYKEIEKEMISRGFSANPSLDLSMFPRELFNDWSPMKEDVVINANRILTRIEEKPTWYSINNNVMTSSNKENSTRNNISRLWNRTNKYVFENWVELYENWLDFKYELKDSDLKRS